MTTAANLKKPAPQDWHWADVMAAIRKRGWSLRQIGLEQGYNHGNSLGEAARRPYPKAEAILAAYAGVDHPMEIWPSRYTADGRPNRLMGRKAMRGLRPVKATTGNSRRNPQRTRGE